MFNSLLLNTFFWLISQILYNFVDVTFLRDNISFWYLRQQYVLNNVKCPKLKCISVEYKDSLSVYSSDFNHLMHIIAILLTGFWYFEKKRFFLNSYLSTMFPTHYTSLFYSMPCKSFDVLSPLLFYESIITMQNNLTSTYYFSQFVDPGDEVDWAPAIC